LERDTPIERRVDRLVHHAHAADADHAPDRVAPDAVADARQCVAGMLERRQAAAEVRDEPPAHVARVEMTLELARRLAVERTREQRGYRVVAGARHPAQRAGRVRFTPPISPDRPDALSFSRPPIGVHSEFRGVARSTWPSVM